MKMRKFITMLLVAIVPVAFFSIEAKADTEHKWLDKDNRSVSLYINIEENDLYIHSDKQHDQVNLQVVDANGLTIYADLINIPAEETLIIPLFDLPEGDYQVILSKNNQPVIWYITK